MNNTNIIYYHKRLSKTEAIRKRSFRSPSQQVKGRACHIGPRVLDRSTIQVVFLEMAIGGVDDLTALVSRELLGLGVKSKLGNLSWPRSVSSSGWFPMTNASASE